MSRPSLVTRIGDTDIRLLRIFRTVAESGGLSAAEGELNIGKSTISKHISDLEYRLDLKLCRRGPAGFSLTEDGYKVLRAADDLLASVSHFRSEVNEIKQKLVGTIRIALFDQCASNPESRLPGAIHQFNKAAPAVEIELSLEPPNVIETMVIGGQLDIGIVALHRASASLNYVPLYGENMYLYCSKDHPLFGKSTGDLKVSEMRNHGYAGISVNSPNQYVGQQLGFRLAAKVQNEQALAILIMSGRYVGFLPEHLARDFVNRNLMEAVLPDEIHYRTRFAAITSKRPDTSRATKLFLDTLTGVHGYDLSEAAAAR